MFDLIPWPVRIGLSLAAAALVAVAAMFVLQLGPFNHRPSAAAKELPKVQAKVTATQAAQGVAVTKAETATVNTAAETEKRTEAHVAQIRASAPRSVVADVPDGAFYASVCDEEFYQGSADCRGVGGQPQGGGAPARSGKVPGR